MKYRVGSAQVPGGTMKKPYTGKQGQYLAFIYYYRKIHGRPRRPKCSNTSGSLYLPCIR
jgi:hypothetical protein